MSDIRMFCKLHQPTRPNQTELSLYPAAFFLGRSDLTGPQMASAIVTALPAMKRALRRFDVPFIARISLDGDVSVFESAGKRFSPVKRIRP